VARPPGSRSCHRRPTWLHDDLLDGHTGVGAESDLVPGVALRSAPAPDRISPNPVFPDGILRDTAAGVDGGDDGGLFGELAWARAVVVVTRNKTGLTRQGSSDFIAPATAAIIEVA